MWLRKCLFACLILAALCFNAEAARLVWDANTEQSIEGYKIHYGLVSGQYTNTVDVGNVTEWQIPTEWPRNQNYYFVATAYDKDTPHRESGYSNEVVYFTDGSPPPVPPAAATDVNVAFHEVAQMAIAYVSGGSGYSGSGSSIGASAINAAAGNCIIAWTHANGNAADVTGVADTAGNSYTKIFGPVQPYGDYKNECWIATGITANASNVVTATFDGTYSDISILVAQYSGAKATGAYDAGYTPAAVTDASSPHTTNSDSTAEDNELIVGFFYNVAFTSTFSNGTGTIRVNLLDVWILADRAAATAGAFTIDIASDSGTDHVCLAVAIQQAAAGASVVPVLMRQYRARRN